LLLGLRAVILPVEVVSAARKPDVFVTALTREEGRKLAQIGRRSKQPERMRRAIVVLASGRHQPVPLIAKLMQVSEAYVRQVIHDFNDKGSDALDPKWKGGRPAKTDQVTRDRICVAQWRRHHQIHPTNQIPSTMPEEQ
jgi:hypothetical protein